MALALCPFSLLGAKELPAPEAGFGFGLSAGAEGGRHIWVQFTTGPLSYCVISGRALNLCGPQFLCL